MATKVILTVVKGSCEGEQFVFADETRCLVGREDCDISLPRSMGHLDVSRQHCLFEIEPPVVRVRDLGSLNGTFVNGEKIGQRAGRQPLANIDPNEFPARELKDGDEVQVGQSVIRVGVRAGADHWEPQVLPLFFL
jgi:eukaryotic-like serine/threonine-protein kinase